MLLVGLGLYTIGCVGLTVAWIKRPRSTRRIRTVVSGSGGQVRLTLGAWCTTRFEDPDESRCLGETLVMVSQEVKRRRRA